MSTIPPSVAAPPGRRREMEVFLAHLPEMLHAYPGYCAAVVGNELLGAWPTRDEAIDAAVDRCGNGPFMVRRITAGRPVFRFTRDLP